jgi:hypothetical protein
MSLKCDESRKLCDVIYCLQLQKYCILLMCLADIKFQQKINITGSEAAVLIDVEFLSYS